MASLSDILGKAKEFGQSDLGKSLIASGLAGIASKRSAEAGQELLKKEGKKQSKSGQSLYENMLAELRSGKYDVAQGQRDAAEDAKIGAEQFVEATRQRGQESRGDLISAIQSGDPRMSALVPRQAQAIEQNIQQAELQGLNRKGAADSVIANLEQEALGKQAGLSEMEMRRGAQGAEAGRQMKLNAMLNQAKAGPNALGDAIRTGLATYSSLKDAEVKDEDTQSAEDGGELNFEDGGGMTNGEFSHENNPKAIIDEDTGVKEGEVTGGELVFNVEQSNKMEELIESGKGDELIEFMKELLSQPQFQA